jgi:hypothetical protein
VMVFLAGVVHMGQWVNMVHECKKRMEMALEFSNKGRKQKIL